MNKLKIIFFGLSFAANAEIESRFILEKFNWQEFRNGDKKILEEDGERFGGAFSFKNFNAEFLTGKMEYDGRNWGGEKIKTKTDYLYGSFEFEQKYKFINIGIGMNAWERQLGDKNPDIGSYSEFWFLGFYKIGVFYKFLNLDYVVPFYCRNNCLGSNLEPDASPFLNFKIKYDINDYFIGVEHSEIIYQESKRVRYNDELYLYQPESRQETLSVFAGIKW